MIASKTTTEEKQAIATFFAQTRELVPSAKLQSAQRMTDTTSSTIRLIVSLPPDTPITSDKAYSLHELAARISEKEKQELVVSFVSLVGEGDDIDLTFLGPEYLQSTEPIRLRNVELPNHTRKFDQKTLIIAVLIAFALGYALGSAPIGDQRATALNSAKHRSGNP